MDATNIIREIMKREGVAGTTLSTQMGMSYNYISSKLTQKKMLTDVFARICDALDYDVIARNRYDGAEFFLSPRDE